MRTRSMSAVAAIIALAMASQASAAIMSDFDDGTLQGWTKGTPYWNPGFGGTLSAVAFGNPGFSMRATDTVGAGGGL